MIILEGRFEFDFQDALDGFKFDEQNRASEHFHGLSHCMKAVDFVVEYEDHYLFVEIKDPRHDFARYGEGNERNQLIHDLKTKFRDTFVYRWAEKEVAKPIYYYCLVEISDSALMLSIMDDLKRQLPVNNQPRRWQRPLAAECVVANRQIWNENFPRIPVTEHP